MSNVVSLGSREPVAPIADAYIVEICEQLLAEAKSGLIRAIAVATSHNDKTVGTVFKADEDKFEMLGLLSTIAHQINDQIMGKSEPQ